MHLYCFLLFVFFFFFFQAEDGIRDYKVTGVQTCALPIWLGIASLAFVVFADGGVSLVRAYKDAALIEISADGRLMLARRDARKITDCPDRRPYCSADVLEVFETATGKSAGQLVSRGGFNFGLARFLHDHTVLVVEQDWKSSPVRIEWEPASGHRSEASLAVPKDGGL